MTKKSTMKNASANMCLMKQNTPLKRDISIKPPERVTGLDATIVLSKNMKNINIPKGNASAEPKKPKFMIYMLAEKRLKTANI